MSTSSLFDFMLRRKAAEADRYRQEQQTLKEEENLKAKDERDFWSKQLAGDADRQIKLMELQSKMAGAMGRPEPVANGFDPRLQEAVGPNYMAGEWEGQQFNDKQALAQRGQNIQVRNADMASTDRRAALLSKDQQFGIDSDYHDRQLAEIERHNRAMENRPQNDLSWMRYQDSVDIHKDRVQERLGKDLQDFAGMKDDLDTLLRATRTEDVAGIGPLAGFVPDFMTSSEGAETRRAASRLLIQILKAQSGATVSDRETARTLGATKLSQRSTNDQFREGVRELAEITKRTMRQREAKYRDPNVVRRYAESGGITSHNLIDPSSETPIQDQASQPDDEALGADIDAELGLK
jgi:hypothetical protein